MTFGISALSFELIIKILSKYPQIEEALIFGSRAKGNHKPGSDIDIAIKGKACTDDLAMTISAELNEKTPTPYFFDVLLYESLKNTELKEHIDRVGKMFYKHGNPSVV